MWDRVKRFFSPPVFDDEDKTHTAGLVNPLLLALFVLCVLGSVAALFVFANKLGGILALTALFVIALTSKILLNRGHIRLSSVLLVVGIWIPVSAVVVLSQARSLIAASLVSLTVIAGLLLGRRAAVIISVISSILLLLMVVLDRVGYQLPTLFPGQLTSGWVLLSLALMMAVVPLNLALRSLGDALSRARHSTSELLRQQAQLQDLVQAQTHELSRRASYLGAATDVARGAQEAGGALDRLLSHVVRVISEQFGFYHTALFLLDTGKEWAVLQAASSEGGQRMLARQHRLEVGSQGIVGYVAARGERRIALDVGQDAVFFGNPDLPETRSEMAVPLRVRNEVLGVLDVQSTESQAFTGEDVAVLQALADQVAMAVSNAQLLQQVEASIEAERRAMGELTREAWLNLLRTRQDLGFYDNGSSVIPAGDMWQPEMNAALSTGARAWSDEGENLAIPIHVREQVVGVIDGFKDEGVRWSDEEITLLETVAEQLGVALEGAQLYTDSQQRAAREQLVGEVTARIRETLDMETVLRTATGEIRQALNLGDLVIRLLPPKTDDQGKRGTQ